MERIVLQGLVPPRAYDLFSSGNTSRPDQALVVFLHGTGATAPWANEETGWSRLAERAGFALAIPQALPPNPDKPPKFLTNPPRWNDGAASDNSAPEDVAFLVTVIDDALKRSRADPRRVCLTGFSNGAAMAFRFAAEQADRVAAIAPVAGHCWLLDPQPARPVPTLYLIGSADPLVPLRGGEVRSPWQHRYVRRPAVAETLERWARAIGCEPIPRRDASPAMPGTRVDTYPGPVEFRSIVIDGLGHHWPGGNGGFNHRLAGPTVDTLSGTELVWDFFQRQTS